MTGRGLRTPRAAGRPGGGVPPGVPRASFPDDGPGDGQRAEDGISDVRVPEVAVGHVDQADLRGEAGRVEATALVGPSRRY